VQVVTVVVKANKASQAPLAVLVPTYRPISLG
jgi:hypothetical protein